MGEQSLRAWIDDQTACGKAIRVAKGVSARHELAAVLRLLDGRGPVVFENVEGYELQVVGNSCPSRASFAAAVGVDVGDLVETYIHAEAQPGATHHVDPASSPVRTIVESDIAALPIPIHHEHDAGAYVSAGVVLARDPDTGAVNCSINRLQVVGPTELRALVLPGRLAGILAKAEARASSLPVAVVIGVHPSLHLASQAATLPDVDELGVAAALCSAPLRVTDGTATDLPLPADAEVVIEGQILAGERRQEGPFGEYPRTYGPAAPGAVVEIQAVHRRADAIFQTVLSSGLEHFLIGGIAREARLLRWLRDMNGDVTAVRLTEGGSCRLHAVVAVNAPRPGDAANLCMAAFARQSILKRVIVVDDDVDIFDDEQVEWACATRFQADRDLFVVPGARGGSLDPSTTAGLTAKLGFDATVPDFEERERFRRIAIPGMEQVDLDGYLADTNGSPSERSQ